MFKSLSYSIFAYLGTVDVKLWAKDNELHYSKDVMTRPDLKVKDGVSTMTLEAFEKKLQALKITEWKKSYEPQGVMFLDGESWTVVYEDTEHKKLKASGENAYPANWKRFLKLLRDVVGDFELWGE